MRKFSVLKREYKEKGFYLYFSGYARNRIYFLRKIFAFDNKHPYFFIINRIELEDIEKTISKLEEKYRKNIKSI